MDLGTKKKIGNFVLTKKKQGKVTFIIVSTLSGVWSMSFRADNKMFRSLDTVEKDAEESLHTWITSLYAACHIVDGDFTGELMNSIDKYFEKLKKNEKPIDDDEDAKILKDERRSHEMREELDKLENE
ncbi:MULTISPECIES: hypothetical protein [Butyricimonas]|uniref:hypothetical protein n=1 Tax=Butyricimonas TaxID=574697 RepID=UPI0007FB2458|nr:MULTISPECIES: hypothetical protein [Butyricimonas]